MGREGLHRGLAVCLGVGVGLVVISFGVSPVSPWGQGVHAAVAERPTSVRDAQSGRGLPPAVSKGVAPHTSTPAKVGAGKPPAAPVQAVLVRGDGLAVPSGSWIDTHHGWLRLTLRARAGSAAVLGVDVEMAPSTRTYTGRPTMRSRLVHVAAGAHVHVVIPLPALVDGQQYHWQVRVRDARGRSSGWAVGGQFGASSRAPTPPHLMKTSVRLRGWSRPRQVIFQWRKPVMAVPVRAFQYALITAGRVPPLRSLVWHRTTATRISLAAVSDGHWLMLVRAVNAAGVSSPPVMWSFGLARRAPPPPRLVAAQPLPGTLSDSATPTLRWVARARLAPVQGYEYRLRRTDRPDHGQAVWVSTHMSAMVLRGLADGAWQVQVRSVDALGNVSPPLTWTFRLDRQAPLLSAPVLSAMSFTPPVEQLGARFGLQEQARVTYAIYATGQREPIRRGALGWLRPGSAHMVRWDGHLNAQQLAAPGRYTLVLQAVDRAGNRAMVTSPAVLLLDRWIRVSLSQEELWAYQGNTLVAATPVTTGGPLTPTPLGVFHVLAKETGWVFHSPWPPGSSLWYPDSPSNFDLLYQSTDGYFIHDAPWRSNYGPGSNSVVGTPGGAYTGSHGCTNVPYSVMARLFAWATVGTLIQIVS